MIVKLKENFGKFFYWLKNKILFDFLKTSSRLFVYSGTFNGVFKFKTFFIKNSSKKNCSKDAKNNVFAGST